MASESFKQEFLNTHNTLRAKHGAPAMTLDSDLCGTAQEWANHLLDINSLEHSKTSNGENVYCMFGSGLVPAGKDAVESWYSEIKDYNWSNPGFSSSTGHFTQVVWKASTKLGVGMATNGSSMFVVGQYSPAGNMNMEGYFKDNVGPLAGRGMKGVDNTSRERGGASPKKTCTLL